MALFTVHHSLVLSKMNPLHSDLCVHSMESPSHYASGRWSDGSCLTMASNDPRAGLLPPQDLPGGVGSASASFSPFLSLCPSFYQANY